jgi:hypothetical protein
MVHPLSKNYAFIFFSNVFEELQTKWRVKKIAGRRKGFVSSFSCHSQSALCNVYHVALDRASRKTLPILL